MQEPDRVNRFIRRGESLRAVMMAALRRNLFRETCDTNPDSEEVTETNEIALLTGCP